MNKKSFINTLTVAFLTLSILLTLLPATAYAAEDTSTMDYNAEITVPADADLSLFAKEYTGKNYKPFTHVLPVGLSESDQNSKTYFYSLTEDITYNLRVSGENYVTYVDKFTFDNSFSITIDENTLNPDGKTSKTIVRDLYANNGHNVGDIFLNINPCGYLKLASGDQFTLKPMRNWQSVDSTTNNYFINPDFHYSIIDENGNNSEGIITIDDKGIITAVDTGTVIVLVTYDAFIYPSAIGDDDFFGAIWPENTGVFVVSVNKEDSGIKTGITLNEEKNMADSLKTAGDVLDSEHDVIYFTGDSGEYTFTPGCEGCSVWVASPVVETSLSFSGFVSVPENSDKSFTVPLSNGRNIVKVEKNGNAEYHVITAKPVTVTINNGNEVCPGDEINIVFDTLYHPINKLDGIYNMNAQPLYTEISGYENTLAGGLYNQYTFASDNQTQNVSNILKEYDQWGVILYEKDTSLIVPEDYDKDVFTLKGGTLYASGWGYPSITHRTLTDDFTGASGFASPLSGYFGSLPDINIPITLNTPYVKSLSVTTPPSKTVYQEGESFDPTGMVVTAVYSDNTEKTVTDYSYTPSEKLLVSDKEITITYSDNICVSVPITVNKKQNAGSVSSGKITVYFTLYGDTRHGTPEGKNSTHTMHSGNLEKWIPKTKLTMDKGSTVLDATIKALTLENIPYTVAEGNYISSVNGLSELDNGSLSGWMYTLNGKYPSKSISEQTLSNGNSIILHYTDDYTKERSSVTSSSSSSSSGGVKLPAVSKPEPEKQENIISEIKFNDVTKDDWYYKGANYVCEKNLMDTVENNFNPDINVTRAQFVETLYRLENTEFIPTSNPFDDISDDAPYTKAVLWAQKNEIVSGISENQFAPNAEITREQFASVLYRYAVYKNIKLEKEDVSSFDDCVYVSDWAIEAMSHCVGSRLLNGVGNNMLSPKSNLTRAQLATVLMRFCEEIK